MTNKLIRKKPNRLLTGRNNYFNQGGVAGSVSPIIKAPGVSSKPIPTTIPTSDLLKMYKVSGRGNNISTGSSIDWGNIASTAMSTAGGIGGSLISGGLQSGAGNVLSGLGSIASGIPGGQLIGAGLQLAGGLFNRAFGSQLNEENIAQVEDNIKALKNFQSNASDFDSLAQNWANADVGMSFSDSFIGKDGWFSNKAKNKAADLRRKVEAGNVWVQNSLNNNAENISTTQMQNLLANYTAYGGPLYFAGGGDIASRHQGSTIDFENSKFARFFRSLFSSNKGKFSGGKTGGGGSRITPGEVTKYKEEKDTTIIPLPIVQTFNEAFAKARKGGDKTFQFNGKTYSTALGGGKGTYEAGQRRKAIVGIVPDTIIDTRLVPYTEYTWALGGSLFADGGSIHIDPANRGKFTETKRRTGKTTEELTHSKNPITRKRAIFAQNAKKWKHSFGGDLTTHGANFDTGITLIGNGGTHENNPYEGVPMGVDQEGTPNLVEEGEVIFNDYVFSNRLKVPKAMRNKYKLREKKDLTFADAALQLAKESEERPNDPISQNGLRDSMSKLMAAQEQIRTNLNSKKKYARGGKLGKLYDGYGLYPNFLFDNSKLGNYPTFKPIETPKLTLLPGYKPYTSTVGDKIKSSYTFMPSTTFNDQMDKLFNPEIKLFNSKIKYTTATPKQTDPEVVDNPKLAPSWMRYIPAFASGAMSITDALGLTNQPDYSEAQSVLDASESVSNYSPIKFNPVGNYLTYKPFDRDYYINKLNAESGAARRAIMNTSGGNRAQAIAGILATNSNALDKMGSLARQAEEYNLAQRQQVEQFNRATDMFNSEGFFKADSANQSAQLQAKQSYLRGVLAASELREKERQASAAARSANLSNFINSLGDIGRENFSRNMIMSDPSKYYTIDDNAKISYKNSFYDLSEAEQDYISGHASRQSTKNRKRKKSRGGYLTIK